MPRIYRIFILAGLVLALVASSGIVYAHFADNPKVVESATAGNNQPKVIPSAQKPQTTSSTSQSGPCTKTVIQNNSTAGASVTNETKTDIHCDSQTQNGSNSVNITNDSSQSATTGDSTGSTGTVNNNDTTNFDYSQ